MIAAAPTERFLSAHGSRVRRINLAASSAISEVSPRRDHTAKLGMSSLWSDAPTSTTPGPTPGKDSDGAGTVVVDACVAVVSVIAIYAVALF